jgi:hypothetical protein
MRRVPVRLWWVPLLIGFADTIGQAWPRTVLVKQSADKKWHVAIVAHELRHVIQWEEMGFFGFALEYLRQWRKYGYHAMELEAEARAAEADPLYLEWARALLASPTGRLGVNS